MLKTITLAAVAAIALSTSAFAGGLDAYNAKYVNTPEAKAAALAEVCDPTVETQNVQFVLCDTWRANGVPNGDVRIGIVAATSILGAVAGGAVVANPALVGAETVTIFGWTPTLFQGALLGAAVGGVVAGAATN